MTADEFLDELDAAHTAWQTGSPGWPDRAIEAMECLPKLIGAVRAVLAKCEQMEAEAPKPQVGGFMAEEFRNVVTAPLDAAS